MAKKPKGVPVLILKDLAPKEFSLALAKQLMDYRKRYEQGERVVALCALSVCLNNGYLPNPEDHYWMLKELSNAVIELEAGATPNEAFGLAPRRKRVESTLALMRKVEPVLLRLYELHQSDPGKYPLDDNTIAIVAKEFGVSISTIHRIRRRAPLLQDWLASMRVQKAKPETTKSQGAAPKTTKS